MRAGRTLVVVCGLPGVGKTTVSEYLADQLDAVRLRTDCVRKDMIDDPTYSKEETRRTYTAMFERAQAALANGNDVVLDGTFKSRRYRDQLQDAFSDADLTMHLLKVECDEAVVKERIQARTDDASDATYRIYEQHKTEYEPLTIDHVTIDNSHSLSQTQEQIDRFLERR